MVKRVKAKPNASVAIGYLRVSTDDQRLGPDAQRAAIETWAHRAGVTIASWHSDVGVSGATEMADRPGFMGALAALQEHRAASLAIAKRDRLARDPMIAISVERALSKMGAQVVSADGSGNGDGPSDAFMRRILDAASEHERALIRARTTAALATKKARGERVGHIPFGMKLAADGRHLEANEGEQSVIATVRELRAAGTSTHGIARELNARGLASRSGKPWLQTQIVRILAT